MARNYPADVRLQNFYTENYDLEAKSRLNFFNARQRGDLSSVSAGCRRGIPNGLPLINPMQFARQKKLEEDETLRQILSQAKKLDCRDEMKPIDGQLKEKLYDGFTKEEKGRYQYLKSRHLHIPESKFTYPVTSAMDYGWKVLDSFKLQRSPYANCNVTKYNFYTRSGVPDLSQPASSDRMYRSKTMGF